MTMLKTSQNVAQLRYTTYIGNLNFKIVPNWQSRYTWCHKFDLIRYPTWHSFHPRNQNSNFQNHNISVNKLTNFSHVWLVLPHFFDMWAYRTMFRVTGPRPAVRLPSAHVAASLLPACWQGAVLAPPRARIRQHAPLRVAMARGTSLETMRLTAACLVAPWLIACWC